MTQEEKWFRRLERCLKDMPSTVELGVNDNKITLLPVGAIRRVFERDGDTNQFDEESMGIISQQRIITCGESL